MAELYEFLDRSGVQELAKGILSTVNQRIQERIVDEVNASSDDRHVASARSVYRAIMNSKHVTMMPVTGDIDTAVPLDQRSTNVIYLQRDDENDTSWQMYIWNVDETVDEDLDPSWICLGKTEIDLSNYWSKSTEDVNALKTRLGVDNKVDKDSIGSISDDELSRILNSAAYKTTVFGDVVLYTLTINWLNPDGGTIADPYVNTEMMAGESYSVTPPTSNNYYSPQSKITGTIVDQDVTIDVTYNKVQDLDGDPDDEF